MVIATVPRDFCISQTHDTALGEMQICITASPRFFPYVKLCSSCGARASPWESSEGRRKKRRRQPAGGGKTKGKVREEQERERGSGRGQTEERIGEERKRRRGEVEGEREALCWGSSIPLVFGCTSSEPRLSGSQDGPPPLSAQGEEGSVAGVLWPLLCPAVHSAGSTILYIGADQQGKSILLYFYTTDLLTKEGGEREVCIQSVHITLETHWFTVQSCY